MTLDTFVPHPAHHRVERIFARWIASDREYAWLWGLAGCGKTTSIEYFASRSSSAPDRSYRAHLISYQDCRTDRPATFWCNCLQSFGVNFLWRAKPDHLYASVLGFLRERAALSTRRRVVLFVDEGDSLMSCHHALLDGLLNDLKRVGCRPLIVFVGAQPPVVSVKAGCHREDGELTQRMTVALHQMHGLRSRDEVESVLEALDRARDPKTATGNGAADHLRQHCSPRDHATLFWNCYCATNPRARQDGWSFGDFIRLLRFIFIHEFPKSGALSRTLIESVLFDGDPGARHPEFIA